MSYALMRKSVITLTPVQREYTLCCRLMYLLQINGCDQPYVLPNFKSLKCALRTIAGHWAVISQLPLPTQKVGKDGPYKSDFQLNN